MYITHTYIHIHSFTSRPYIQAIYFFLDRTHCQVCYFTVTLSISTPAVIARYIKTKKKKKKYMQMIKIKEDKNNKTAILNEVSFDTYTYKQIN